LEDGFEHDHRIALYADAFHFAILRVSYAAWMRRLICWTILRKLERL
jgi:hypothetical protein